MAGGVPAFLAPFLPVDALECEEALDYADRLARWPSQPGCSSVASVSGSWSDEDDDQ